MLCTSAHLGAQYGVGYSLLELRLLEEVFPTQEVCVALPGMSDLLEAARAQEDAEDLSVLERSSKLCRAMVFRKDCRAGRATDFDTRRWNPGILDTAGQCNSQTTPGK